MVDLKEYFQQKYQGRDSFLENIVFPIFGEENFSDLYDQSVFDERPELKPLADIRVSLLWFVSGQYWWISILSISSTLPCRAMC